jgi:hypothetical protein
LRDYSVRLHKQLFAEIAAASPPIKRLVLISLFRAGRVQNMKAESSRDGPPVINTKLNFKRTTTGNSSSSKRRKTKSNENLAPHTNGTDNTTPRKPDFDFTEEDDAPLPKVSRVFWPDKYTFKDALFAALSDPDEAAHWTQVFGSEIHIYPRPRPAMSDDEYAMWVREQVYGQVLRETHRKKAMEAESERLRQQAKIRQQREERERKFFEEERKRHQEWQKLWHERLNADTAWTQQSESTRYLRSKAPAQRWKEYLAAFQPPQPDATLDILLLWQQSDVPWPTPSGSDKDISEANIRSFVKTYTMKYSEQAAGDWKKAVKQNQYYWHPDKFRQIQARKLEKLSDEKKEEIMARVTEVSQILNKLANEKE